MRAKSLIFAFVALGIGFAAGRGLSRPREAVTSSRTAMPSRTAAAPVTTPSGAAFTSSTTIPEDLGPDEKRNIDVFRRASLSVVHVANIATRRDFFSLDVFQIQRGMGSGFVWDSDGHIVTNFHVIEGGDTFKVRLDDQSEYEAKLIGSAPDNDLAVLRVKAPSSKLVPLARGNSRALLVGQTVLALGNPFGLDHSLTVGVVSALGRELQSPSGRTIHDVIQTDAAINPGNSGGPLLDSRGRLVGINSAIYSPSGASAGVGFAVPVDAVSNLIPQLISHGRVIRPGIGIVPLPDAFAARLGLEGVVIQDVRRGSPAARADLQGTETDRFGGIYLGDRIVAVDGKRIQSLDDMLDAFERAGVGKTVTLTVERGGRQRQVRVPLAPID